MGEITTGSGEILKSSKSKKINIWNVSDLKAVCYSLSEKYSHGQILIHYFKSDQVHLTAQLFIFSEWGVIRFPESV